MATVGAENDSLACGRVGVNMKQQQFEFVDPVDVRALWQPVCRENVGTALDTNVEQRCDNADNVIDCVGRRCEDLFDVAHLRR